MISLLADSLVVASTGIQVCSLVPIARLIRRLPSGAMRRRWWLMSVLSLVFIGGYVGYAIDFWNSHTTLGSLIVPTMFFLGSWYVWLTTTLSLQTAIDIGRLSMLERETLTDPLMGIANRRGLDRRLEETFDRARRYSLPLAVLLIDIDHFKSVNDRYGHLVGDRVLAELGPLVREGTRQEDFVARYGGEELLVICPNTTAVAAAVLAERLRQVVQDHCIHCGLATEGLGALSITISIGVADCQVGTDGPQGLLRAADSALYRAKHAGRNRVTVHDWSRSDGLETLGRTIRDSAFSNISHICSAL